MKKIISLTLALAIVLSMSVCAFATTTTNTIVGDGAKAEVTLTADITKSSTLISVTMPTTIAFQIATKEADPNSTLAVDKDDTTGSSVAQGYIFSGYTAATGTVQNMSSSNVAVDVSLVGLKDNNDLTNKVNLFLSGPDAKGDALDADTDYATDSVKLIEALGIGKTSTLSVSVEKATTSGKSPLEINLPAGSEVSVVATLKVTAVAE